MADVVARIVNWEVRTPGDAARKEGAPSVILSRTFSDRSLAGAVVRFQASNVGPYDSRNDAAVAALGALLEVDDPARCGYPVPDAMADLLLAAPDPSEGDGEGDGVDGVDASPADRLAAKLTALGYDRLWNTAWSGIA